MTKSNKIGMVGGFPIPEVNRLMNAFMAGAREVNPQVEFKRELHQQLVRSPQGQGSGLRDDSQGRRCDVRRTLRVSDAAKEKGKLAIGNVINTQAQYPDTVVSSALWNMEPSIDRAIKLVKEGKFTAEDYGVLFDDEVQGRELAPLGTFEKKVPAADVTKVNAREKEILDGKFVVKVDDSQPKLTAK